MNDEYSRQSFLGPLSQWIIENAVIGIAGLGGGGSQMAQQFAHLGFLNYVLFDPDVIEAHNLNRLIGGTAQDVMKAERKIDIASRMIREIRPKANIKAFNQFWQDNADALRRCDVILSPVDGFDERRQIEAFARRYLIPLIDIGMDVACVSPEPPRVNGQVILSMPGCACMTCMGFLNEKSLAAEAAKYCDAGVIPQVVWPNGVLASTAVGIVVDLLTDWSGSLRTPPYLSYCGNNFTVSPHVRVKYLDMMKCSHFPLDEIGPQHLKPL